MNWGLSETSPTSLSMLDRLLVLNEQKDGDVSQSVAHMRSCTSMSAIHPVCKGEVLKDVESRAIEF